MKSNTLIDDGLVNGTTYYYVVSAVNLRGESGDSNEASGTPGTPSDLTVPAFVAPVVGGAGAPLMATVTTANQGAGQAQATTTRFYLSDNTVMDAGDRLIGGSQDVPPLAPGASASASVVLTLPLDAVVGQRYMIAKSDDDDVLFETSETNNVRVRGLLVGPDLSVPALTMPATAAPGATISVLETTTNVGGDRAGGSTTRFFFSTNAALDAADVLLASRSVQALDAGAASSATTSVTIPAGAATGTYYVIAEADGGKSVAESRENNNATARTVRIGADLIVSALTVPAKSAGGASITVSDTTLNQGAEESAASTTRFYLSENAFFGVDDELLPGGRAIAELAPGASTSGATTLVLPAPLATGTYYVIARADDGGVVGETLENNNTLGRTIQIGPDLAVSGLGAPTKAGAGDAIAVTETTSNQGGGPAPASTTQFYLSVNGQLDAGDVLLTASRAVGPLAAGVSSAGATQVTIPLGTAPGAFYLIAKADGVNAVEETAETNNTVARLVWIGPDLIVSGVSATSPVVAGAKTSVAATVVNQGAGSAGASTVHYYLSTNLTFDATDIPLGESRSVPALAAGASNIGATLVTIPGSTTAGTYFVIVRADADGGVSESNETNNTAPRVVQVTN